MLGWMTTRHRCSAQNSPRSLWSSAALVTFTLKPREPETLLGDVVEPAHTVGPQPPTSDFRWATTLPGSQTSVLEDLERFELCYPRYSQNPRMHQPSCPCLSSKLVGTGPWSCLSHKSLLQGTSSWSSELCTNVHGTIFCGDGGGLLAAMTLKCCSSFLRVSEVHNLTLSMGGVMEERRQADECPLGQQHACRDILSSG